MVGTLPSWGIESPWEPAAGIAALYAEQHGQKLNSVVKDALEKAQILRLGWLN
jgi:hypothetical protein